MKKSKIISILLVAGIFITSTAYAKVQTERNQIAESLFTLGNADRTYDYKSTTITCYLGQLFPGQPIYWCMYPDMSMDHSWFVYQVHDMDTYYTTGGATTTYTLTPYQRSYLHKDQ